MANISQEKKIEVNRHLERGGLRPVLVCRHRSLLEHRDHRVTQTDADRGHDPLQDCGGGRLRRDHEGEGLQIVGHGYGQIVEKPCNEK